jgi:hypothetical protein
MPQKEARLQYDGKAKEIVAQMTLEEKIGPMSGSTSASLGEISLLPPMSV